MIFSFCLFACLYGLFLFICREVTERDHLFIDIDVHGPLFVSLMPMHSWMSRFVARERLTVAHILSVAALAEIATAIIERVVVAVVALFAVLAIKNEPMHHWSTVRSPGVPRLGAVCPLSTPIPLHQPFIVNGVYDGDLAFCERDKSDRLILRLNNRRALAAWTGHDLTSNEIAVFGRFSIVANIGSYPLGE